jgi:hypothetical protein
MMVAKPRRKRFGRGSEQLDAIIDQLQLTHEELEVIQTGLKLPAATGAATSLVRSRRARAIPATARGDRLGIDTLA